MELLPSLLSRLKTVDSRTVDQEYSMVRSRSLGYKKELGLTSEAGALKENIKKNRYKDILPYDQSRVELSLPTTDSNSDYINASFIKGATGDCKYIGCQGPLSSTVTDFWRMIWQYNVKVIVMACREIEMGKRKCECYWAAAQQSASFGPFTVSNEETHPNEDIVVRNLTVTFQQASRSVIQYQFLSWPDHDVPYETAGVLDMLERARSSRGANVSPLLIHCSAGCGRTGVICALDYIHDLLVTKKITPEFSILNIVLELRRQRPSTVQTKDQFQFIYTAAISMFEQFLQTSKEQVYSTLQTKKTTTAASSSNRLSQQVVMNDTYAVVNKPKHAHPPPSAPTYSAVPLSRSNPGSRTMPTSHHYDNDPKSVSAAPIYSTVKPRAKQQSLPPSVTPIYDIASPTGQKPGEGSDYQLVAAEKSSMDCNDYEDFSSSVSDVTSFCSPGSIGFNCRIQKPRGPRDPPAEWTRVER
ncbi:tyrosine-protein phosphatase non-receptor type 18 isoform X2 [Astatotilapia calliptera]|uniref:tyrosine-protein phosphatase non-receptor type 18 isoform X2 n=1 Tax=Astatotilapia calliptera TaxID=8154 RepID=UPI000E42C342|nr:tyrosine-protein phosphatase non-receptor type 18-like isoform X2 [Astatotilapia calliptera]